MLDTILLPKIDGVLREREPGPSLPLHHIRANCQGCQYSKNAAGAFQIRAGRKVMGAVIWLPQLSDPSSPAFVSLESAQQRTHGTLQMTRQGGIPITRYLGRPLSVALEAKRAPDEKGPRLVKLPMASAAGRSLMEKSVNLRSRCMHENPWWHFALRTAGPTWLPGTHRSPGNLGITTTHVSASGSNRTSEQLDGQTRWAIHCGARACVWGFELLPRRNGKSESRPRMQSPGR